MPDESMSCKTCSGGVTVRNPGASVDEYVFACEACEIAVHMRDLRKMLAKPAQRDIMADVHRSIGQSLSKLGVSGNIQIGYPSDWDDIPDCPFHVPGFDT